MKPALIKVFEALLAGLLLVSCQRKPPTWIEVESATISRDEDKVVCRVTLSNPKADPSDLISLGFFSSIKAEAVVATLKFHGGEEIPRKLFSGFTIEGGGPGEGVISFDGDAIPGDEDLSRGKLGLTFLSYRFGDGDWQDFETPLHFDVTFDPPESGGE